MKSSIEFTDIRLTKFLVYSDRKTIHFHYIANCCIFNSTLIIFDFIIGVTKKVIKE